MSSTKNDDILQKYIQEEFGKELLPGDQCHQKEFN
jgi:hypothetical protein